MKTNGKINKKIKIIYLIEIFLMSFTFLSTAINIIYDIINCCDDVFFSSVYLLMVPYLNFFKTSSFFELIPFIIFWSISIILAILASREYMNCKLRKMIFIPLIGLWYIISTAPTIVAYNFYNGDDETLIGNMLFSMLMTIFLGIVFIIKFISVFRYNKRNGNKEILYFENFQMHATDYEQIKRTSLLSPLSAIACFLMCLLIKYLNVKILRFYYLFYIIIAMLLIFIFVGIIYECKRYENKTGEKPPTDNFLKNLNIMQIITFILFAVSFLLFAFI